MSRKAEEVYQWLQVYINENKFSDNPKLPSENALSKKLSASRSSIRVAFDRLVAEDIVCRVKGSGTYINKRVALSRQLGKENAPCKIGLILQGQDKHANLSLIDGIKNVLPNDQVDLRTFITDNKFSNERKCLQTVMDQGFDGFIVDGVKASLLNPNLDCYQDLYRRKIPVFFYNNYYREMDYPRVINDDIKSADHLIYHLIKAGHRKIASIFVYDNYQSITKFHGMTAAMRKYGVEFQDDYVKWCVSDEAHNQTFTRSIAKFIKGLPKCTAIVCCNHMIYQLVLQVLGEKKKRVPNDYSLVCFDYSNNDWEDVGITCSIHQGYRIGSQVATRLMRMLEFNHFSDNGYSLVLQPQIYIGNSIRNIL